MATIEILKREFDAASKRLQRIAAGKDDFWWIKFQRLKKGDELAAWGH